MPFRPRATILPSMGAWMGGWEWLWMTFVMLLWLVVVVGGVYAAVRVAQRRSRP